MYWSYALCAVALLLCLPLYIRFKPSRLHLACCFKCAGTLCAFSMALIAAIRLDPRCVVCAAAIFLYAAADYLLEFQFMLGAGFFLAGHICSVAFFLNLVPVSVLHLIAFLVFGGMTAWIFYVWRKPIGKQMPVFIVYGLSLALMGVCAIGCFTSFGIAGILIALGGVFFFISDLILLRRLLFPSAVNLDWAVMITYYASVLLFGMACLRL